MTTKGTWIEFTGSDEQIDEMENAQYGVLLKRDGEILDVSDMVLLWGYLDEQDINEYLICSPHPLAAMICQQARTGQPVWVKMKTSTYWVIAMRGFDLIYRDQIVSVIKSTTPDWDIPGAKYSFTPFEGEV